MDYSKALYVASGFFLVERIPEEIIKNYLSNDSEKELLEFVEDNLWAPFEYKEPIDVFNYISNAAEDIVYYSSESQ